MMNTKKIARVRNILILLLIVLQVSAVFSALMKYTPENIVFYGVMVYFSLRSFWKTHHICAFMWSILTAYLLGWFWGLMAVVVYWVLYFINVKYASRTQKQATQHKADESDKADKSDKASNKTLELELEKSDTDIVKDFIKQQQGKSYPQFLQQKGIKLLLKIEPIIPIPFLHIKAFWHKIYIVKKGRTYAFHDCPFFGLIGNSITDLCSIHRPDVVNKCSQIFGWGFVKAYTDEDPEHPIRFMNSYG